MSLAWKSYHKFCHNNGDKDTIVMSTTTFVMATRTVLKVHCTDFFVLTWLNAINHSGVSGCSGTQTSLVWYVSALCWIQSSIVTRRSSLFGHVARLHKGTLAHQALRCHIDLSLGRLPDLSWRQCRGHPRNRWLDQLRRDNSPANVWRWAGGDATVLGDYALGTKTTSLRLHVALILSLHISVILQRDPHSLADVSLRSTRAWWHDYNIMCEILPIHCSTGIISWLLILTTSTLWHC